METNHLFREIGQVLSPGEARVVLMALRHSPSIWQNLEQEDFLQAAVQQAGDQAQMWSPGALALVGMGDLQTELLQVDPLVPLPAGLQEKTVRVYQAAQRTGEAPANLRDACLLALALRERRRLTGTWSGLLQELVPKTVAAETLFQTWRGPLALLYSYIPDPEEMLRGLLPKNNLRTAYEWIVLTQLSQPKTELEHIQAFTRLLSGMPVAHQLNLLRSLSLHGYESAAAQVAESLLAGHPAFASLRASTHPGEMDLGHLSNRALALQQMGTFYQLTGEKAQALALFDAAEATLDQWLSGLTLQRLNARGDMVDGSSAVFLESAEIEQLVSAADWLKTELGTALISHASASSIIDMLDKTDGSPFLQLKAAAMLFEQEPAVAQDMARQGATEALAQVRQHLFPFNNEYVYTWRPEDAVRLLLQVGLAQEAAELAVSMLDVRPTDSGLLRIAGKALEAVGDLNQGIWVAQSGAVLEPTNPEWHRNLGGLWRKAGDFQNALAEWKLVLALENQPGKADRLNCAQAAMEAGALDEAVAMSEAMLAEDPGDGVALGLLGRTMIKKGELNKAGDLLVQSTLFNPDLLESWLALAAVQQEMGKTQRALETLSAAVTALPNAPETHLALGKARLSVGMLADALPYLQKAFLLSPELDGTALAYSQALVEMGHITEARQVLERVRAQWKKHWELAYNYALVLLEQNNPEGALPVLEEIISNGQADVEAQLLYARVLLGEYRLTDEPVHKVKASGRMQQAEQALRRILENEPENLEARMLLADIRCEKGELEAALSMYQELVDLATAASAALRSRAQWGLGRTAMRLGKQDIAVAAMQEACQARPDYLPLQRGLADAMLQANLRPEALAAAENALKLAPDMVDNLAWYADFVGQMGEPRKAVEALEKAVQIDPNRADLLVDLAHRQVNAGDLQAAAASLQQMGDKRHARSSDFRRAAQIYLRLQDTKAALALFERALENEPAPADLLFEVAGLQDRLGNVPSALELVQKAVEQNPHHLLAYLLQADLLVRSDRPQAALALLERALRTAEHMPSPDKEVLGDIHSHFTHLLAQEENFSEALAHAEKALEYKPERIDLCYQAVNLSLALAQGERAERILWAYLTEAESRRGQLYTQGREGLDLLGLQIEMALDNAQDQAARAGVEEGMAHVSDNPRFLAAHARLLAREGNLAAAKRIFKLVQDLVKKGRSGEAEMPPLWLADAALETQQWQEAVRMYEQYARTNPASALGQIRLARALVLCAEKQHQCEVLDCRANSPGSEALREENHTRIMEAVWAAEQLANTAETRRWRMRGSAVFTPNVQSARELASLPPAPADTAALMQVLRRTNNVSAAVQLARRYPSDPHVLLELALCHLSGSAAEGLEAVEQLVETQPGSPLAQVALAKVMAKTGEMNQVLDAYERALKIWDNEPAWHDIAGDICIQVGVMAKGMEHRQKAYAMEANNAQYALKLGQACLSEEDIPEAVTYLERATELDPQLATAWLELATAYHISKIYPQAMEAARQAIVLDPNSSEALMIAGETALSIGDLQLAYEYGRNAVQSGPDTPASYLFFSSALVAMGRQTEAIAMLDQAPDLVKNAFPVAFEQSRLVHQVHGARAVLAQLEMLAKDHPEEPGLLSFLAQVQAECGEVQSAERNAFKALRLDPNQPELTLMLGRLQLKTGQLDQAVYLLTEAIRMAPEVLESYLELGAVYQRRREFMQALQVYRQAMKVAPNDYQAYYQSGLILRDSKDYSGAEAMLRRAADRAPENLSIRRQLVGVIALNLVHSKQEVSLP